MIRINLLPPQLRQTGFLSEKNIAVIVLLETLMIVLCLYGYGWWRLASLTEQLQAGRQELALLQPVEERRLNWAVREKTINEKAQILMDVDKDQYNLYGFLLALGKVTPDTICLTKVVMGQDRQILAQGYALDYGALLQFTAQLAAETAFGQFTVQSCEKVQNDPAWQGYLVFVIKSAREG